ncbi:MAG: hypothetical protein OEY01_00490 [Desulfobulbaceae bacterium]|nr:hypothetical protein [Desulfobulbaceae bacterium]HIJ77768.1 hypothetical protein [Deltaproteobacteria bacterium]
MSEEVKCISFELAQKIVGAVMEEEHLHDSNRRVLTVYDIKDREICWYDAEDIMRELAETEGGIPKKEDELKAKAVEHIMHQIPEWAVEDLLAEIEGKK